jgi:hypothetical protein
MENMSVPLSCPGCKTSLLNPGASEIALKFQEFTPFLATNKMLTILQVAMVTLQFLKHRKTTVLKKTLHKFNCKLSLSWCSFVSRISLKIHESVWCCCFAGCLGLCKSWRHCEGAWLCCGMPKIQSNTLQFMLDLTEAFFSVEICIFLVMSFVIAFMGTDAFKRVNLVQFSVLSLRMWVIGHENCELLSKERNWPSQHSSIVEYYMLTQFVNVHT